jgi:hypothetical protein
VSAIAFDTLKFVRRLVAAGVPEQQAEAQAELMAEAFVYNMDSLVTRDYLDARLDARFAAQDARIDARFSEQHARIDARFAETGLRFAQIHGELKLHRWILGAIAASTVLPVLHSLLSA